MFLTHPSCAACPTHARVPHCKRPCGLLCQAALRSPCVSLQLAEVSFTLVIALLPVLIFTAVWRWRLHYMSWANKVLALICLFLSVVILWCESVQPFAPQLSLLGGALKGVNSFMWKHIISLVMLLYYCWCTFLSVFRLKVFGLLELSGNRQTDAFSLLFNAAFMCRLQFAISFNFLQITTLMNKTSFDV